MGRWFTDYLKYSGYRFHGDPQLFKQLIATVFPVMSLDPEFTPDNLEPGLLEYSRLLRSADEAVNGYSFGDQMRQLLSTRRLHV